MLSPGRHPGYLGGDGLAGSEGFGETIADVDGAADTGEEGGLQKAGDAEGGRNEDDAEGGGGADEKVLYEMVHELAV